MYRWNQAEIGQGDMVFLVRRRTSPRILRKFRSRTATGHLRTGPQSRYREPLGINLPAAHETNPVRWLFPCRQWHTTYFTSMAPTTRRHFTEMARLSFWGTCVPWYKRYAMMRSGQPLLDAEADRLGREASQLALVSNLMYAQSAKYAVFAGALYFAPGGGAVAAVLSILSGIYGAAGAASGQASGNKGVQAATAATKAVKMQDDIESLQLKLATGVGFTPRFGQIVSASEPVIRSWTPAPGLMGGTSWQPCDYIGPASYILGATNLGRSVLGIQLVASTTNWSDLGMWQPYVPE